MSMRYPGGIISATPPSPTSSAASGVWVLEAQLQAQAAGNWPVPPPPVMITVEYLVVAGGGGGGTNRAGGGGAGGLQYTSASFVAYTNHQVTVGAGGSLTSKGSNSVFSSITSLGGGYTGVSGGSGGGGARDGGSGGAGTAGQGNNGGGLGVSVGWGGASGGGGAGAAGQNGTGTGDPSGEVAGNGGDGLFINITGTSVLYACGGGGDNFARDVGGQGGNSSANGGLGGATAWSSGTPRRPTNGNANTGTGGGGADDIGGSNGGSGIVILKYPNTFTISNPGGGLSFSTTTSGSFRITTFTAGTGNITWS